MREASLERHKDFPDVWFALLILAQLLGIEVLLVDGFYDAGARFSRGDPRYTGIVTVFACGFVFSLLLSYKNLSYRQLFHPSRRPIGQTLRPLVLPLLATTAGAVVLATKVNELVVYYFPMSQSELDIFDDMVSGGVTSVITLCVLAPFIEEMLFRGLFLRSFLWNYSPAKAIVLSALLFGAAHLNVYQFVTASALGFLSGWLYFATHSLWPSIFEHALYNGGVMLYYYFDAAPTDNPFVVLAAVIMFAYGLCRVYGVASAYRD